VYELGFLEQRPKYLLLQYTYFDKALSIDPNDKFALTGKDESLDNLGNYSQAIPYLDKALAIDPNFKVALDNKQATLSKTSPQQPQQQQQTINESRVGLLPRINVLNPQTIPHNILWIPSVLGMDVLGRYHLNFDSNSVTLEK
jgi:tetratricopeptide (TPR) repeat protein